MTRAAACLLAVLLASAPTDARADTPIEQVGAEARRLAAALPDQVGPWQRIDREPRGDARTGFMVGYQLVRTRVWATVFVSHPEGLTGRPTLPPVPDGADSEFVRARATPPGWGAAPGARQVTGTIEVPAGLSLRCGIVRHVAQSQNVSDDRCATGVGGLVLLVRATAPLADGSEDEARAADAFVARLAVAVAASTAAAATRSAAPR